jgi:6-phosphogluconolactonase
MATDALLGRITRDQRPAVMRMEGELGPEAGSASYEALVREHLGAAPRWDLMLLGLGPDAHCASLFPGKPEVEERQRLVVGAEYAGWEPFVPRISLTLPALNAARRVVFLVTGADKAAAMKRAFGDPPDPASPAAHVRPAAGELLVLCDAAAAKDLT